MNVCLCICVFGGRLGASRKDHLKELSSKEIGITGWPPESDGSELNKSE